MAYGNRVIPVLFVLLALAGCSGSSSGGGGSTLTGPTGPAGEPGGPASDLQGTWESTCLPARAFGLSETARISISGQTITQLSRVSATGNCVGLEAEVARTGSAQRRGQVTGNTFQIDTLIETVRVKPLTALGAQILNLAGWCGFSDWAANQEKDVTAKTGSERCFTKQPATTYSVYSVEGNRLYFGRGEETTQPARRPVELNREEYYIRR